MPRINVANTVDFAAECEAVSAVLGQLCTEMERLYGNMELDLSPSPTVNFTAAHRAADDVGDVGYVARTLAVAATDADHVDLLEGYRAELKGIDLPRQTIDTADNLIAGGDAGAEIRDRRNARVSAAAMLAVLKSGGDLDVTDDGLIVGETDDGVPVDLPAALNALGLDDFEIPTHNRGGTTYGNVFVTDRVNAPRLDEFDHPTNEASAGLLRHEEIHTYQWAAAGARRYVAEYLWESRGDLDVKQEWHTMKVGPFSVPVPIKIETDPLAGCGNRFEEHAGHTDGGYDKCSD